MNNVLILGDGLLGGEIIKQTGWNYISRKKDGIDFADINSYKDYLKKYDTILNCIGYTNTYDENRELSWNINYKGVADLVDYCRFFSDNKLVHISTDYIYGGSKPEASENDVPVNARNWYSYCKMLSDAYIQLRSCNYLIIRTSFKPRPFPYPKALAIQTGNFDYVDVIAEMIIKLIMGGASGVYNVGTKVKTIYGLAKETKFDVKPLFDPIHSTMPYDVSMNLSKLHAFLGE